jgi:hypothetical protein
MEALYSQAGGFKLQSLPLTLFVWRRDPIDFRNLFSPFTCETDQLGI